MRTILWDITSRCNMRCKHCYNVNYLNNSELIYTQEELEQIFKNMEDLNVKKICFLGGEPTISQNIVNAINIGSQKKLNISITTNGQFFSEEFWNCIINDKVDEIIFSVEGISSSTNDAIRGEGSLEKTLKNVKKMVYEKKRLNLKTKIFFSFTVNKLNYTETPYFIKFASDLEIDGVLISKIDIEGAAISNKKSLEITTSEYIDAIEMLVDSHQLYTHIYLEIVCKKRLIDYLKLKYTLTNCYKNETDSVCNGVDQEFYIDTLGRIFPCRRFKEEIKVNNLKKIKTISRSTFNEILNADYLTDFYRFTRNISNYKINNFCKKCKFSSICKPCPYIKHFIPYECIEVEKRYQTYMYNLLSKKLALSNKILVNSLYDNTIKFYDQFTEFYYKIDRDSYEAIKEISTESTISEGLKKYYNKNNLSTCVAYQDFVKDYLEFLCDLYKLKIINFE